MIQKVDCSQLIST